MIVHLIVNVEDWSLEGAMPRTVLPPPQGISVVPDVPNYAWAEYGMRVGFWRLLDTIGKYAARATLSVNANVCKTYPQIVDRSVAAGWEMMGHGFVQRALNLESDERGVIRSALDLLESYTGRRPRGWLGPGLCETWETLEHLVAERVEYVCDWGPMDDQPVPLRTDHGPITAIPYPADLNDIVIYAIEKHRSDELFERGRRQFDTLYAESAANTRVMAIALHPYLTGAPHRIGELDKLLAYLTSHEGVVFFRGGDILDWYLAESG
jgi:allantoinase